MLHVYFRYIYTLFRMKMENLNALEVVLIGGLVQKYPQMEAHVSHLRVSKRELTSTGLCIHIDYQDFEQEVEPINALFSNSENIEITGLKKGLGYVIDITNGIIQYIELVTYGEKWNGKIGDFRLIPNILLEE